MITIRRADERGRADLGWLQSRHSFSFGGYYDPAHMGFSALRVINDDQVAPGAGFDTHGHRDMEIISLVLQGSIAHKDSTGNVETLPAGEFQLMSAGRGIYHSEYNASQTDALKFLQIWIEPDRTGGEPGYQQRRFGEAPGLTLVASPDGRENSLRILQDACLYQLILPEGGTLDYAMAPGRKAYLHLISGAVTAGTASLVPGDGAGITELSTIRVQAEKESRALLFDLP